MITTSVTKPRQKKTQKVIPQIINITHAASTIQYSKILKNYLIAYTFGDIFKFFVCKFKLGIPEINILH